MYPPPALVRSEHTHHVPVQLSVGLGPKLAFAREMLLFRVWVWIRDIVVLWGHKSDTNPPLMLPHPNPEEICRSNFTRTEDNLRAYKEIIQRTL